MVFYIIGAADPQFFVLLAKFLAQVRPPKNPPFLNGAKEKTPKQRQPGQKNRTVVAPPPPPPTSPQPTYYPPFKQPHLFAPPPP